ncbi:MAG: endonuclease/exonuclease/phosphatase family protein [Aquamicrobium sp.]|nr:endonuclease/exonuclease/phosphatase family protein [Aquamicrobium sp.]
MPDGGDTLIASYNVHKGIGFDRRFDPARTIAVIREMNADVVALQEASGRFGERESLLDLDRLAHECDLVPVPVSGPDGQHGWHGNLILFREGTVTSARQLALPGVEPRGAVVIDLTLTAGPLRIIAAHLGLLRNSRAKQIETLLSVAEAHDGRPTLLMGDLNEWRVGRRSALSGLAPDFGPLHATLPSFPSRFPLLALDRVLGKPHDLICGVELHDSPLARVASDHLPIKASIRLGAANGASGDDEQQTVAA